MNEQVIQGILLVLIAASLAATLLLYFWKARKQAEYRGDERWQAVQLRAVNLASISLYLLILVLLAVDVALMMTQTQLTLTWNRMASCALIFVGVHNAIELLALRHFDRQL